MFQVNAYIISELHANMPSMFGKEKAKSKSISELDKTFQMISDKYKIPLGEYRYIKFLLIHPIKNIFSWNIP